MYIYLLKKISCDYVTMVPEIDMMEKSAHPNKNMKIKTES